jgi:hypothetical protein
MTRSQGLPDISALPFGSTPNEFVPPPLSQTRTDDLIEIANGFMGFFSLFKGGRHPYHKEYMSALHSFMATVRI